MFWLLIIKRIGHHTVARRAAGGGGGVVLQANGELQVSRYAKEIDDPRARPLQSKKKLRSHRMGMPTSEVAME